MKIFAVLNQKGGTGKTTVTMNLGAELARRGRRVLVVDIDPQGNATSGSGVDKLSLARGVYDALRGEAAAELLVYCRPFGYWLLGTNSALAGAEIELTTMAEWRVRLREALAPLEDEFEFVFVDCPPSLGVLSVNALVAAHQVLIPMQCEYFALEGLSDIADTIQRLREGWNPNLVVAGIVKSMLDSRNVLARDVSQELDVHFGAKVFRAAISRNVRIAEAPSHHKPVRDYSPSSTGAAGFRELGDEFLERFA